MTKPDILDPATLHPDDVGELDDAWFATAKPAAEFFAEQLGAEDAAEFLRRLPGQRGPGVAPKKVATAIRLDADVVAAFKAAGRGWQSRINAALRLAAGLPDRAG